MAQAVPTHTPSQGGGVDLALVTAPGRPGRAPAGPPRPPAAGVAWLKALGASQAATERKHKSQRQNNLSRVARRKTFSQLLPLLNRAPAWIQ